jgi:chromatin remodeling complex protein RSC6
MTEETIEQQFSTLNNDLSEMSNGFKDLLSKVKSLGKAVKQADKKSKTKPKSEPKPMKVSKELRTFIGDKSTDNLTKAYAMKSISAYIKQKGLQLKDDKRRFLPDKKLLKLFNLSTAKDMTFVEINKNISHHLEKL